MPTQRVRGGDLHYEVHGRAGDPVVLVHGSLVDLHSWDLVVPGLAQSMEVVTYDRRGHGESAPRPRPSPVRDDAADLAALLEALNIYPAHVVAHSYGGAVALRLAIDRPEMVRSVAIHEPPFVSLLAADPATALEGEQLLAGTRILQQLIRSGQQVLAAQQLVGVFSTEPGAWGRLPVSIQQTFVRTVDQWAEEFDDPEALLPDLGACRELMVPALLTYGSESPAFLRHITQALGGVLHNSQIVGIPESGHAPHVVRPQQYVGLLLTFLLERNVPVS
jgi:pimeloyl-ACP methyl ester carboxylesterase